jgi:hypothetical protein
VSRPTGWSTLRERHKKNEKRGGISPPSHFLLVHRFLVVVEVIFEDDVMQRKAREREPPVAVTWPVSYPDNRQ